MLTSFSPRLLANMEGAYPPHDFPVEQGHGGVPLQCMKTPVSKSFSRLMGTSFFGENLFDACSTWGINVSIMSRVVELRKCIFQ